MFSACASRILDHVDTSIFLAMALCFTAFCARARSVNYAFKFFASWATCSFLIKNINRAGCVIKAAKTVKYQFVQLSNRALLGQLKVFQQ